EFINKLTPETRMQFDSPELLLAALIAYRCPVGLACRILPAERLNVTSDCFLRCETSFADGERDWPGYRLRLQGQRWMLVVGRRNLIELGRILTLDGILPPPA